MINSGFRRPSAWSCAWSSQAKRLVGAPITNQEGGFAPSVVAAKLGRITVLSSRVLRNVTA